MASSALCFAAALSALVAAALAAAGNDVVAGHLILVGSGAGASDLRCPRPCSCVGPTADCSKKGLTMVPANLPTHIERL